MAAALLLLASACLDPGALLGPEPSGAAPRLRLRADAYALYDGDRVRLGVEGLDGRAASAEVVVLDRGGRVVWRSARAAVADTSALVPLAALPARLYADTALRLSAALEVAGARVWATDDTTAALSRDAAARRPVRFRPGRVVAAEAGRPGSFALDSEAGRLYFAAPERARIGVVDLAAGRETESVEVPAGPVALRFHGGRLGALVADGSELVVFGAAAALSPAGRVLLPALRLDVETPRAQADSAGAPPVDTLRAVVRPYARGLAWGCPDAGCRRAVAFTSSGLSGAGPAAAVLRRVSAHPDAGAAPLVVPAFQAGALPEEAAPSRVRIYAAGASGADSLVFDQGDRTRCPAAVLGAGPFDVAPAGPAVLYAAASGDAACGEGTRLMRIDHAASDDARINAPARRNLMGEDRIGPVAELRVSPDGRMILVRAEDRVHLFGADLRLRGTLETPAATAIAWVEGGRPDAALFAVSSAGGVALYDTARRVVVAALPLDRARDGLLALWRTGGEVVAASAPLDRDGLVITRVPLP